MRKIVKNQEMNAEKRRYFIFAAIIMIQVVVMLYWANEKSNFYIDELYSMGYASNFTGRGDTERRISDGPEWQFNKWINNALFKEYLLVSEEEQIFQLSFTEAVQKMLTGRNYFGLLNIAESLVGYDFVSARPGIVLNILIFILTEIAFLLFMQKMKMELCSRYLALVMFGFSAFTIGFVEYIRFYIIVIMYFMWLLNLLYFVWTNEHMKKIIPAEIGILALTYLSYKNSELTLFFFGAFSLCFVIALVITKKWKRLISYIITGAVAFVYILITTNYVGVLLHPTAHPEASGTALRASLRVAEPSLAAIASRIFLVTEWIGTYYFGHYIVILLAATALIAYSLWVHGRKKEEGTPAFEAFHLKSDLKNRKISQECGFILVLIGAAVFYTLFAALAGFKLQRYYCFTILLAAVIFWGLLDRLIKKAPSEMRRGCYAILAAATVLSALIPFRERHVDYIYEDDRDFIAALEPYNDRDVDTVLLVRRVDGAPHPFAIYDCVNLTSENSDIYLIDMESYSYEELDFSDEFILWDRENKDSSEVLNDLAAHGYEIESLGTDHVCQAYICRIK
mgnify:CR=1 FL=1